MHSQHSPVGKRHYTQTHVVTTMASAGLLGACRRGEIRRRCVFRSHRVTAARLSWQAACVACNKSAQPQLGQLGRSAGRQWATGSVCAAVLLGILHLVLLPARLSVQEASTPDIQIAPCRRC
jgi:hypothetical protein